MNEFTKSDELIQKNMAERNEGKAIQWSCHPVKHRPLVSVGIVLLVLLIVFMTYNTTGSVFFGLLACIVMFVSLARFFLPTHYRMSDKGVTVKTTTQTISKNWTEYRSFYPDKNGVLLSPFAEPSRLENFRGIYIMFNNNRVEVTEFVKSHIAQIDESKSEGKN